MKEVYIAEPNMFVLSDIKDVLRKIYPSQNMYKALINPFEEKNIKTASLNDILALTDSGSLDLMILPLHLTEESRKAAENENENHALEFDGVQLGLKYQKENYSNPILLTTDGDYSGTQKMFVENAGGFEVDTTKGFADMAKEFALKTSFLNLYSTQVPERSKIEMLLHLLEGTPKIGMVDTDTNTDSVTIISPSYFVNKVLKG